MGLLKANTKWVLFLGASTEPEDRHVKDLAFGLMCLERSGIDPSAIAIYVDGTDRANIAQWISLGSPHTYAIKTTTDFFAEQAVDQSENLVMFVTGHGSIFGIDAVSPVKPSSLLGCLKKSPKLRHAVVYLGQCYAGIFNFVGAGRAPGIPAEVIDPHVILVGATNLYESISSATKETFPSGEASWVANLFLLHVFKWISNPVDVDGDGKVTVMDSYKYAGVLSNSVNKNVKAGAFLDCINYHEAWGVAKKAHAQTPSMQTQLDLKGVEELYNKALNLHAIHQECWILNSYPAQVLEL